MFLAFFALLLVSTSANPFFFNGTLENVGAGDGGGWSGVFRHPQTLWVVDGQAQDHTARSAVAYAKRVAFDGNRPVTEDLVVDVRSERILCYKTAKGRGQELFRATENTLFPLMLAIEYRIYLVCDGCAESFFAVVYQNVFGEQLASQSRFSLESFVRVPNGRRGTDDCDETHQAPRADLSVATFNLFNFNVPWSERCDLLGKLLVERDTDVLLLQEVRYDSLFLKHHYVTAKDKKLAFHSGSQAEHMLHCLRRHTTVHNDDEMSQPEWNYVSERAMYYAHFESGGFVDAEGLAVFFRADRFPFLSREWIRLPRIMSDSRDEHQRLCLRVTLQAGQTPVLLYNTHWSLAAEPRRRSAASILEFVERSDPSGNLPAILAGDLNETPESAPVEALLSLFSDVWAEEPTKRSLTFPSDHPKKRIDFLLVRDTPDDEPSVAVLEKHVLGGKPTKLTYRKQSGKQTTEKVFPSDHLGLFARVQLLP